MFKLFLVIAMVVPFVGALSYLKFQERPTPALVQEKKAQEVTVRKFAEALQTKKLGLVLVYNKDTKGGPSVNMSDLVERSERSLASITPEQLSQRLARYSEPAKSFELYDIPGRAKTIIQSLVLAPMVKALLVSNRAARMPDADMTEIDRLRKGLRADAKQIGDGYTYEVQSAAAVLSQHLDTAPIAEELERHLADLEEQK